MAISRGSELFAQTVTGTSLTFAFNNVAGDCIYSYGFDKSNSSTVVTGVTYNAQALTKFVELAGGAGQNDRAISAWRRVAPATGSNNVVVTASESVLFRWNATSFLGVDQTTPENGTDTSTGNAVTTISTDITTTADNCWMMQFSKDDTGSITYTNTTGDSIRLNADAGGMLVVDTNGAITPAGLNTITDTMSSVRIGALAWAIRPAAASTTIKTWDGIARANLKTLNGVASASIKTINGIT